MTGFDLGEPAADADEESEPKTKSETETADEQEHTDSSPGVDTTSTARDRTDNSTQDRRSEEQKEVQKDSSDESTDDPDPGEVGPAFPYSDVRQDAVYARAKTWDRLEDEFGMTVTPNFREEALRDEELREIHDAMLELVIDNIDELADRVMEKRIKSYRNEEF